MINTTIFPQDLYELLKSRKRTFQIIDLRTSEEFEYWHIYGSVNISQKQSSKRLRTLGKNKKIIVVPGDSAYLETALSTLKKKNIEYTVLDGGMNAWNDIYEVIPLPKDAKSSVTIFQLKRMSKGCLSYVLVLPGEKSALIIDPGIHIKEYEKIFRENNLKPVGVIDTHVHSDHVTGGLLLSKKYKIPYMLPKKSKVKFKFIPLEDKIGKILKKVPYKIISTPGHTKESISLYIDDTYIFTGDTLLLDLYGRPDIGEDTQKSLDQIKASIMEKLFLLRDAVFILPSHANQSMAPGPIRGATMRYVKVIHKLQASEYDTKKKTSSAPLAYMYVKNLREIKDLNIHGPVAYKATFVQLEEGSNPYFYPDILVDLSKSND